MRVKIDDLSAQIDLELEQYSDEVRKGLQRTVTRVSGQLIKRLRETSPKKSGAYAKGWAKKEDKAPGTPSAIVYNRDRGWLTHLLENGHAKAGGGRVEAKPHIRPAAKAAEEEFVKDVEKMLREVSS